MAHDGTGAGWDINSPQNSEDAGDGAKEIRDLRIGVANRVLKEHVAPAASSVGGEHKAGSAKAYYQSAQPTVRPDGSTALVAADAGRLWIDKDDKSLSVVDDVDGSFQNVVPKAGTVTSSMLESGFVQDVQQMAVLHQRENDNVNGGTFTGGSWQNRIVNQETYDPSGIVSLNTGTGEITLGAGNYRVRARAVGYEVGAHQVRFRNMTDSSSPGLGNCARSPQSSDVVTESEVNCEFTITGTKVFRLQHFAQFTKSSDGQGKACATGTEERYAEVIIFKMV